MWDFPFYLLFVIPVVGSTGMQINIIKTLIKFYKLDFPFYLLLVIPVVGSTRVQNADMYIVQYDKKNQYGKHVRLSLYPSLCNSSSWKYWSADTGVSSTCEAFPLSLPPCNSLNWPVCNVLESAIKHL